MMPEYHIGTLDKDSRLALSMTVTDSISGEKRPTFLQPKRWTVAKLESKVAISWDTRILTFALEHPEQDIGIPVGQHLSIRMRDPATLEVIIRSYTPISHATAKGRMEILVKVYFEKDDKPSGKMSIALDTLPIGHGIDFKGPIGKFQYLGRGMYCINGYKHAVSKFLMVCGGSGITPILQVFRAVMQDATDFTSCTVLDCNRCAEDILCKKELDGLVELGKGRGKICYTLTQPDADWGGRVGRIDGDLIRSEIKRYENNTVALICGPKAMESHIAATLAAMDWPEEQVITF